jgi:hypothetical protein
VPPPTLFAFLVGFPLLVGAFVVLPDLIGLRRTVRAERRELAATIAKLEREQRVRTDFPVERTAVARVYEA